MFGYCERLRIEEFKSSRGTDISYANRPLRLFADHPPPAVQMAERIQSGSRGRPEHRVFSYRQSHSRRAEHAVARRDRLCAARLWLPPWGVSPAIGKAKL